MSTLTTTTSFHCIFRSIYIRQLIFNHINDISNRLAGRKGKDRDQILPERRQRVISEYCCHQSATSDTLEHLVEWCQVDFDWEYLNRKNGYAIDNQDVLEYLIKRYPSMGNSTTSFLVEAMNTACENGYLSTVKLIDSIKDVQLDLKETQTAMYTACCYGFIDIVKYLHENRTEGCSSDAIISKLSCNNRTEGASTKAMDWASEYGHLDIVKQLNPFLLKGGYLDVVKFLYKHRSECVSTSAVHWAVANGSTEIIKFLEKYLDMETESKNVNEIIFQKVLKSKVINNNIWKQVREIHQMLGLETVKYNSDNVDFWASNRYFDHCTEKYLQFKYVSRQMITFLRRLKDSDVELVDSLVNLNNLQDFQSSRVIDETIASGSFEVVRHLHQRGFNWSIYGFKLAIILGHVDILKYIIEYSNPITKQPLESVYSEPKSEAVSLLPFNPLRTTLCLNISTNMLQQGLFIGQTL
ncbi:hypothetical protein DFA_03234 [Cavenderia fasciculata]|uniref:Ankyrin repeat-containing protein n=1 Tax=Cavenderia fasciculata TaxID=261658 RepID=F4PH04_CACFS|nr:uncharacterized protein DFA_03234 [Cavenderia fasciculata]EGG24988.1 hypothetical protein DFA_03234 [Cavenderia fasciculata]|eukprot:XP_004362839.1 hypothetical protein DFA_03234 [Cavenderia fasciculata]